MKILDWVHHKFRHNNIKPFKDLNIGSSCIRLSASLDDQDLYTKPNFGSLDGFTTLKQPKQDEESYFSQSEANSDEETSAVISEFFHGFLSIGTLGSDASINEPATPTFAPPLEDMADGIIMVTENDLKFINYELEKFLEAASKEEGSEASSARNSNVSVITLGGKQMERVEDEDYLKTLVCPLQGYLFGSSFELPGARKELTKENGTEAKTEVKKEEKEPFKTEEAIGSCAEKSENQQLPDKHKHKNKSAMRFMKKIMKKVRPSSKSSPDSASGIQLKELDNASDSVSSKKKLHKILSMFQRKIHPESSMPERDLDKAKKSMAKNSPKEGGCNNDNLIQLSGDNTRTPQGLARKEGFQYPMNKMNPPRQNTPGGHGEHWIKIDDDYLVLEL